MQISDIGSMPEYFDRYILLAENISINESLEISLKELEQAPIDKWVALGDRVYAANKWTVKDILQHCIDTERVFVYRATAIARGDQQEMIPFDEEEFARNTTAGQRTIEDLLEELMLVRKGSIAFFKSLNPTMLQREGKGYNGMRYCPLALGFMLAGHQRWHFKVLEERYYPLLKP